MPPPDKRVLTFDEFVLDPERRRLFRHGEEVPLTPKVFELLLEFARHPGEVLRREELMDRLWGDRIVEESNLTQSVFLLRKALGDNEERRLVVTEPGVGYRFVGSVQVLKAEELGGETSGEPGTLGSPWPPGRRSLGFAVALLVCLASLYGAWRLVGDPEPSTLSSIESLAVLPFVDLETRSTTTLGLGIADLVFSELDQRSRLELPTLPIVLDYHQPNKPPAETGHDLGVDAVLAGTTVQSASAIRATLRIVLSGSGRVLFSEAVEAPADDPRLLQNRVAASVLQALRASDAPRSPDTGVSLHRRQTAFEAYELALVGRYHLAKRSPAGLEAGREAFARALEIDPSFAEAWSDLADAELLLGFYRYAEIPTRERYVRAEDAARRALDLDPSLVNPHAVLGMVELHRDYEYEAAFEQFQRALEKSTSSARAHHWYAWLLFSLGFETEGEEQLEMARRLEPLSLILRSAQAGAARFGGRSERSLRILDEVLAINPDFGRAHYNRALALEQLARFDDAEAALARAAEILGPTDEIRSALAHLYFRSDRVEEGRRILDSLRASAASPAHLVPVLCASGDLEGALEDLHRAIDRREVWVWNVVADPRLEPARRLPAFERIEDELFLEQIPNLGATDRGSRPVEIDTALRSIETIEPWLALHSTIHRERDHSPGAGHRDFQRADPIVASRSDLGYVEDQSPGSVSPTHRRSIARRPLAGRQLRAGMRSAGSSGDLRLASRRDLPIRLARVERLRPGGGWDTTDACSARGGRAKRSHQPGSSRGPADRQRNSGGHPSPVAG